MRWIHCKLYHVSGRYGILDDMKRTFLALAPICMRASGMVGYYIRKFRQWGVKGVVLYVRQALAERAFRRKLLENARRFPVVPQRGITLIASLSGQSSLDKTCRDFARALAAAGIPHQVYDLGQPMPKGFRVLKYTDIVEMFYSWVPDVPGVRKSTIAFWEFDSGLPEQCPQLLNRPCVIAMSDFNAAYYREALPPSVRVCKILYPLRTDFGKVASSEVVRARYGLRPDDFVVFFNFDYGSGYGRKNPEDCVRAFAEALGDTGNAKLVFKTKRANSHPESVARLMSLADSQGIRSRIVSVDDYLPADELYGLANACDVYLSLHRGEGFGLGIAEAMLMGKPVVVTDFSSTTEFCRPDCSIPVNCALVPNRGELSDQPAYAKVRRFAAPDVHDAALKLRRLYDDRSYGRNLGARASQSIRRQFSVENFRASVEQFLDAAP